jgi:hypothetical protein
MKEREIVASDPSGVADCNCMAGCLKGDHQYVAFRRQEVVRCAYSSSTEKQLLRKKKNKKWDRSTANGERINDWPLGMYDNCTDQEAFVLRLMSSGNTRYQ